MGVFKVPITLKLKLTTHCYTSVIKIARIEIGINNRSRNSQYKLYQIAFTTTEIDP